MDAMRVLTLAALVLLVPAPPLQAQRPSAINVADRFRPSVAEALEVSPTFRQQWERIAAERLVNVYVYQSAPSKDLSRRASTEFRRYSSGLLHAVVEIPAGDDHVELLAHEFEHVIEQIERIDLRALVRAGSPGVKLRPDGAFETLRAQQAGIAAALEAEAYAGAHPERR